MSTSAQAARAARHKVFREKTAATRAILVERFPACFSPKGADKQPLAIGITKALIAACPDIRPGDIRDAVRDYAQGPTYLRNMIVGAPRISLDGQPCGTVDEGGAALAACRLRIVLAHIDALALRRSLTAAKRASAEALTEAA